MKRIRQGQNVAEMSAPVMPTADPLVANMATANADLVAKVGSTRKSTVGGQNATEATKASARNHREVYGALGNGVQIASLGDPTFITSTGYWLRSNPTPPTPLTPPASLRATIGSIEGRIVLYWARVTSAWNYEAQYTTDLTGATGWTDAPTMSGAKKVIINGLTSATKYALRVRALNNAVPGPWSVTMVQTAP